MEGYQGWRRGEEKVGDGAGEDDGDGGSEERGGESSPAP